MDAREWVAMARDAARESAYGWGPGLLAALDALDAALDAHPRTPGVGVDRCGSDGRAWPCPTVAGISAALDDAGRGTT